MAAFDFDEPRATEPVDAAADRDVLVDRGPHRLLGIPYWALLIAITLLAGVLRFTALDKPSIWGDEAATWRRISGSFPEAVQSLRTDGFMPTHYLLTWWIKEGFPYWGHFVQASPEAAERRQRMNEMLRRRGVADKDLDPPGTVYYDFEPTQRLVDGGLTPTPFVMRFVPALLGILTVPAMYFLASFLVARRTALLAAIFTCCSAYMLGYSRDAKMYMQTWFFVTLHVGCLFWWLSAYRRHRPQVIETAREYEPFPKQRELGVGVAGVLPGQHVGHIARAFIVDADLRDPLEQDRSPIYTTPPTRLGTFVRWACWVTSGLGMIAFNAAGLAVLGLEVLFLLATVPQRSRALARLGTAIASPVMYLVDRRREQALLRSVNERPSTYASLGYAMPDTPVARLRDRLGGFSVPPILGFLLGATACFFLWQSYKDTTRFYDRVLPEVEKGQLQVDVGDAGISWVEPYNRGRTAASLFRAHATAYLLNWEWVKPWHEAEVDPRALLYLKRTAIGLWIAIGLGLLPWKQALNRFGWNRERRERVQLERGPMPATAMLLLAVWLFVPTYGFYVAGGAWSPTAQTRERPVSEWNESGDFRKVRAVTPIQAVMSIDRPVEQPRFNGYPYDPKVPLQGVLAEKLRPAWVGEITWGEGLDRLRTLPWSDLFVVQTWDNPASPPRTIWILAGLSLGVGTYLLARMSTPRRTLVLIVRGVLAVSFLFGLLTLVYLAVPMQAMSVWMPRYAGFVWPAFAIGVCVLIRRLPFAPLRWSVIAVLIGANLTQFVMRCRYAEPPTAQQAADFAATIGHPENRFFASTVAKGFGGPGAGSVYTLPYLYYCANLTHTPFTPDRALGGGGNQFRGGSYDAGNLPNGIRGTIGKAPEATTITLWLERYPEEPTEPVVDQISARLGPAWRLTSNQRQMAYDHWTWRQAYALNRLVWERIAPAAPPPAKPAPPATRPARPRQTPR